MKVLPERERQVEGRAGRAEQGDIRNIKEGPSVVNEKGMASFPVKRPNTTEIIGESVTESDRDEYPNAKRHSTENVKAKDVSKEGATKCFMTSTNSSALTKQNKPAGETEHKKQKGKGYGGDSHFLKAKSEQIGEGRRRGQKGEQEMVVRPVACNAEDVMAAKDRLVKERSAAAERARRYRARLKEDSSRYQERLEKDRLRKREERRKLREKAKEADRVLEIWKQNPSAMAGTMGTPHLAAISHPTQMQVPQPQLSMAGPIAFPGMNMMSSGMSPSTPSDDSGQMTYSQTDQGPFSSQAQRTGGGLYPNRYQSHIPPSVPRINVPRPSERGDNGGTGSNSTSQDYSYTSAMQQMMHSPRQASPNGVVSPMGMNALLHDPSGLYIRTLREASPKFSHFSGGNGTPFSPFEAMAPFAQLHGTSNNMPIAHTMGHNQSASPMGLYHYDHTFGGLMTRDPQLISSELLSHLSMGAGSTPKGYCTLSRDDTIPQSMNRNHIDEDACVDIDRIGSARSTSATDAEKQQNGIGTAELETATGEKEKEETIFYF